LKTAYSFAISPEPVAFRLDRNEGLGGVGSASRIRHVRKVNGMLREKIGDFTGRG
jgi:hypothetical protein